jgi:predicted DNA-binding transcriptional regulator AlpA
MFDPSLVEFIERTAAATVAALNRRTPRRYLNTREAAEYLGCSAKTLQNWRSLRKGPAFVRIGGKVAYGIADLDRFIREGESR